MARAASICCEHGCPNLAVFRGRCRVHARIHERAQRNSVATKLDGVESRRARSRFLAAWRDRFGNWCPGYKRPGHRAVDLTVQHRDSLAEGGNPAQPLTVLCRSCNSRHGADMLAARKERYG